MAEDERLFEFRKSCYTELAEQSVEASMTLSRLVQGRHQELFNMDALGGFARANAKLALVADTPTLNAASDLSNALVSTLLSMVDALDPLFKLNIDIDIDQKHLDDVFAQIFKMQEEQKAFSQVGDFTSQQRITLDRWITSRMKDASELKDSLEEMRNRSTRLMHQSNLVFSERLTEISTLNIEVMKAIRSSIGVSTDLDAYIAKSSSAGMAIRAQAVELTKKLSKAIDEA